ncbi:MAG: hypothetical protein Q9163_002391 [Psora crenata]
MVMLWSWWNARASHSLALRGVVILQWVAALSFWSGSAYGMDHRQVEELRQEAEQMFYHGFDNYMNHAFPEDEIRPISCLPLTRDTSNPGHIELNDALGNYSLTLIDSLSTLAIIASSPSSSGKRRKNNALLAFQKGVAALVEQYGDGTNGTKGTGKRAKGFDLDSKVQVFETAIRGVGGLLSAHLFAVGRLPIRGYDPKQQKRDKESQSMIEWPNKFFYNGQLLRLAENLARRLLPAFLTPTGLPYPRVNLRYGIPFYPNSPLNRDAETGQCPRNPSASTELTETCSAGAGSLVLEFTTLSRLTGDQVFEQFAKRAFWSVWERKSSIGLVGSGIDAESGHWTTPYTGIGAGIDSFYEYAAKASVLLSGSGFPDQLPPLPVNGTLPPEGLTQLVLEEQQTADAFMEVWLTSHASIKRHLYRGDQYIHPHYIQGDLYTGAPRAFWIDSLSAFYPGLLAHFGKLEESIETHLLFTALWTRYSALPERWSTSSGGIESGLGWWGGRPEFIESTYYLYQATKDPWYLYVGEMALRDIKRRCWARCGWSGIQDVRNGDKSDRMESFFLGETIKYLFLLFDPNHPLNRLDAPFVFSTEGHPLILPRRPPTTLGSRKRSPREAESRKGGHRDPEDTVCPLPPAMAPFSISATAARHDLFHAAKLACLHMMPDRDNLDSPLVEFSNDHPSITVSDVRSPSNFTYFPWTLPLEFIPRSGVSSKIKTRHTFDLTFPTTPNTIVGPSVLQRFSSGILVNSMSGLRLGMIQDVSPEITSDINVNHYRIQAVNNIMLGKDERIFVAKDTASNAVNPLDPNFTRIRDPALLDLVIDLGRDDSGRPARSSMNVRLNSTTLPSVQSTPAISDKRISGSGEAASSVKQAFSMLLQQVGLLIGEAAPSPSNIVSSAFREYVPAVLPVGIGAAPLPDVEEAHAPDLSGNPRGSLIWHSIYMADDGCVKMPSSVPKQYQVIVMKRGGCSFTSKLQNIPTFVPSKSSLQLVVVVSYEEGEGINGVSASLLVRPLLESAQMTSSGLPRRNPIPMVMVGGGDEVYGLMQKAIGMGVKRRYEIRAQGVPISNLIVL